MSSIDTLEKEPVESAVGEERMNSILFHTNPPGGGVDHTPIIITDGSASIEFTESLYTPVSGNPNRRRSTGLHLVKVSAHRDHDRTRNPESVGRVCFPLVSGQLYEIEFTCERTGQPTRNFVVGGGPTFSPELQFEHGSGGEYQKSSANFPPIDLGQRFGNLDRNITRMQIFRVEDSSRVLVHDCGRVENNCEYRLLDVH